MLSTRCLLYHNFVYWTRTVQCCNCNDCRHLRHLTSFNNKNISTEHRLQDMASQLTNDDCNCWRLRETGIKFNGGSWWNRLLKPAPWCLPQQYCNVSLNSAGPTTARSDVVTVSDWSSKNCLDSRQESTQLYSILTLTSVSNPICLSLPLSRNTPSVLSVLAWPYTFCLSLAFKVLTLTKCNKV